MLRPIRPFFVLCTSYFVLSTSFFSFSATFTVTNINDAGAGSLRDAITQANGAAGADNINFNITGSPPFIITLASLLPNITTAVNIDATTQPGYSGTPLVELYTNSLLTGLTFLNTSNCSLKGLYIRNFGTASGGRGVHIRTCSNIEVSENVISNGGNGIEVAQSSTACIFKKNIMGTDPTGTIPLGNGIACINFPLVSNHIVGGSAPNEGNLLAGSLYGIAAFGSSGLEIKGNKIGTDISGVSAIGNVYGIILAASSGFTVGGPLAGEGNLISGNTIGINMATTLNTNPSTLIQVKGNKIGTDISGTLPLGNTQYGINIPNASNNIIGGGSSADKNIIAYNGQAGVNIRKTSSTSSVANNNIVSHNPIYGSP